MALRRLLSGWLIAMAALARSVAQALERASESRIASAPDPVMAALAERYPGAPAHWLAHVAERTSQLAEAGQAPLSLNSDPTAWPPARPSAELGALPDRPATSTEPEPAARDVRRPTQPSGREPAVPSLAALRDRSSEVWRRPDVARPRRPRPVFAAAASAPTSARPARVPAAEPASRRPRSPLTFVGSPAQAVPSAPDLATSAADALAAKAVPREAAWSEPPSTPATPGEKAWPDAQRTMERPPLDHALAQAPPTDAPANRSETPSDRPGPPPAARRQRSWFFARSASARGGRPLELSTYPARSSRSGADAEGTIAVDPASAARPAVSFSTPDPRTVPPDHAWRALIPPTSRRSIFRMLAALHPKPRPRADRLQTSEPTVARAAPAFDPTLSRSDHEHPVPSLSPSRAGRPAHLAPAFAPIERNAPPGPAEDQQPRRVAHRIVRRPSGPPTSTDEAAAPDKRPAFAPPRTASRRVSRGFAGSPPDDRWPALPPTTFAAPHGVEAPSPRWDQLAREQEEGRWSV
jgi:hypothetical protein